jgi:hypothetical protein
MLRQLASFGNTYRRKDIIGIATFAEYSLDYPRRLFGSIWKTIDEGGNVRAITLLPPLHNHVLPFAPGNSSVRKPPAGVH